MSKTLWVNPWDFLTHGHVVQEVEGSSNQATGKVFSAEYVIYSNFLISLKLVLVGKQ